MRDRVLPSSEPKQFTWRQLSKLNLRSNAHVAYNGKVYDVSSFVSRHPGGVEQILAGAGRDITHVFNSYHKLNTFERVLSQYYVGELIDNELPICVEKSNFFRTVKERVWRYTKKHELDPKIDYWMFLIYFIIVVLYLLSLYCMIYFCSLPICCVVFAALRGFLATLIGGTLHHDSSHFSITHKPWVWKLMGAIADCFTGISSYIWFYRHIIGHHSYTNIEGADPDIHTGPENNLGFFRIKVSQRWARRFLYQHIYLPFLYGIVTINLKLSDFSFARSSVIGEIRINPLTYYQWLIFWTGKLGHIIMTFIIPFCLMPFSHAILCYAVFEVTCSVTFIHLAQLNHVTNEFSLHIQMGLAIIDKPLANFAYSICAVFGLIVKWLRPNKKNEIDMDWAELQVASTMDYCTDSWFWTFISSSLNHQTAHHLFPGFIQSHYRWITPIVKQTCAEFGIKYNSVDSFTESLRQHYKFLKRLGNHEDTCSK